MPTSYAIVRQSEDFDVVEVIFPPSAAPWTVAFSRPNGANTEPIDLGSSSIVSQLKSARIVELDGRLEPHNATILDGLTSPDIVRISNASRGPRSSLSAPTLVVAWATSSSYILPDLRIGPRTSRLVVEITDEGGPISPYNRRWMPDLFDAPTPLREVVLDFSRWSHTVVDPFTASVLYRSVAHLLVHGLRVVLVALEDVFPCFADATYSRELDDTRWTTLPERAENGIKHYLLEELVAQRSDQERSALKDAVRGVLGKLSLMSHEEYAQYPPPQRAKM